VVGKTAFVKKKKKKNIKEFNKTHPQPPWFPFVPNSGLKEIFISFDSGPITPFFGG
jgi:hypothetical protein